MALQPIGPVACAMITGDEELAKKVLSKGLVNNEVRECALQRLYEKKGVSKWLLISATIGFLVAAGPVIGLKLLGFTAAGVAKGSLAAMIQSTFPLVGASTWFAWAQSAAATGSAFF